MQHEIQMMHFKISILLFIFIYFSSGCTQVPNQLKIAERIMDTHPDSALNILNHLHKTDYQASSDRALYGLLLFQALDKSNKPLQPDSVINFSVNFYQSTNDKPHLAKSYLYKAKIYKRSQRLEDAILLYLKALDILQNSKDYVLLGKIYSDMGDICAIQFDYKESLTKYIKAKEYFILAGDKVNAAYKIIDMGRIYRCLKEYNKAQGYYKQALSQTSDSLLQGTAYQEIGINYYYAYQYDSAMYFLKQSIHFPYKGTNFAIRCNLLADLFFDRAQYDSAFHYAIQALKYPTTFYNKRDVYRILANTEYSRGNLKQMAIYISKYQDYTDSVRKIESQSKLKAIENIHNTTKEANTTKRNMVLIVSVLIIILLLSALLVFYLYKRNNLKRKQLNTFKLQLNNKQEFLSRGIQNKIEDIKALKADERKNASADERIKLDKELYINVLHLDKWDDFSREMNHAFNNIVVKLITDYPTITQKEVIWCCLHLLDIPHADRMLLLDVSSDSLYKLKQRFARKLNLKSTKDLDLFLRNLIEIKE